MCFSSTSNHQLSVYSVHKLYMTQQNNVTFMNSFKSIDFFNLLESFILVYVNVQWPGLSLLSSFVYSMTLWPLKTTGGRKKKRNCSVNWTLFVVGSHTSIRFENHTDEQPPSTLLPFRPSISFLVCTVLDAFNFEFTWCVSAHTTSARCSFANS